MDSIFNYLDYRSFLRDFYESRKKNDTFFSYRYMAFKLKMDHSLLVKILSGKRHIADNAIENYTKLCKLKKREALYFETLVNFEKARTKEQSRIYFEKLLALKDYRSSTITKEFYKYFQKWYYVAIRSLLDIYKFRGNYRSLATQLNPPITAAEAKEAITLLEKLKFIKKDSDGVYRVTDAHVSTPEKWQDIAISTYQKEVIKMSSLSIDRNPKETRDISTITMSINKECFEDIKQIIRECRTAIIKRVDLIPDDQKSDRLYQLNIQFIPLSKIKKNIRITE
jgi:uncharacterized protein (TIGR02147 family)